LAAFLTGALAAAGLAGVDAAGAAGDSGVSAAAHPPRAIKAALAANRAFMMSSPPDFA
jgi:hypothetical protein